MPQTKQEKNKKYYESHKELFKQKYEANKDKILLKQENQRIINKISQDTIKHLNYIVEGEKTRCPCGSSFRNGDGAKHARTKKHLKYYDSHIPLETQEKFKMLLDMGQMDLETYNKLSTIFVPKVF